jgi:hypothetical protein
VKSVVTGNLTEAENVTEGVEGVTTDSEGLNVPVGSKTVDCVKKSVTGNSSDGVNVRVA